MIHTIELVGLVLAGSTRAWGIGAAVGSVLLLGLVAGVLLRRPRDRGGVESGEEVVRRLGSELSNESDAEGVARRLLDELGEHLGVGFAALTVVSDDQHEAHGLLARTPDGDLDWWRDVHLDLDHEPSGVASTVFEADAHTIYDASSSSRVSTRLAQAVGAKSVAHAPLVVDGRVLAVVSLATTDEHRRFARGELALLRSCAAEAATALRRVG